MLVAALALAGCGSTSGPGAGGGSAETEAGELGEQQAGEDAQAPGATNDPTYFEAGSICVNLPIEQLAQQYGVEATPEAVARRSPPTTPTTSRRPPRTAASTSSKRAAGAGPASAGVSRPPRTRARAGACAGTRR